MGISCSRRASVTLSVTVQHEVLAAPEQSPPTCAGSESTEAKAGALPTGVASLASDRARQAWQRVFWKIRLIRRLRRAWAHAGHWLQAFPCNSPQVSQSQRARVAKAWAHTAPALLKSLELETAVRTALRKELCGILFFCPWLGVQSLFNSAGAGAS